MRPPDGFGGILPFRPRPPYVAREGARGVSPAVQNVIWRSAAASTRYTRTQRRDAPRGRPSPRGSGYAGRSAGRGSFQPGVQRAACSKETAGRHHALRAGRGGPPKGPSVARFFSENAGGGSPGRRAKARPRILAATRPDASRAVRRGGEPEGPGRRQSIPQGGARTRRIRVVAPGIASSWEPALGRPSQGRVARRAIRLYDLKQSIES